MTRAQSRKVILRNGWYRGTEPLRNAWYLAKAVVRSARLFKLPNYFPLFPVSISTVFSETHSPKEILAMSRRCIFELQLNKAANRDLVYNARCHEVRNSESVLSLKEKGLGAVVCSFHLGPFHHTTIELAHLDDGVLVFAAPHLVDVDEAFWMRIGSSTGPRRARPRNAVMEVATPVMVRTSLLTSSM